MRSLTPVTLGFFDDAAFRVDTTVQLAAPPAQVFETFADPAAWPRWFPLMTRAAWRPGSSPGLGAEREVAVTTFGRFHERFIAWEPGVRFAFTMTATTSPLIDAMAEDYRLFADGNGTRLEWTIAATPSRIGRLATPVLRVILRRIGAAAGRRLDAYLSAN